MPQGFYELLGLPPTASPAEVDTAYDKQLAALVRRLRHARQQGADVRILEAQERSLREARGVLADPVRRRRYDAYRTASEQGLPRDAEDLWGRAAEALVDPIAVSALRVVRTLTDLPVGEPFPGVADPSPAPGALRLPPALPPSVGTPVARPSPAAGTPPSGSVAVPSLAVPSLAAPSLAVPGPSIALPAGAGPALDPTASEPASSDGGFTESGDTAVVELIGRVPVRIDPLEELLADLSGTDGPAAREAGPVDPIDRLARDFGYDGRFLKAVRQDRGLQLDDLSRATRISNRYLEAIEANGYDQLPAATFVRGYLKEIVKVLDLGDRDVVGGYMALFQRHRG